MDQLIEALDAAQERAQEQRAQEQEAKNALEMKKEIEVYQAATKKPVQEVNYRKSGAQVELRDVGAQEFATLEESVNTLAHGTETQIELRDAKAQEFAALEESVNTLAHGSETQIELRDAKAQEFAALEESVNTLAHSSETQIESHVETAMKEMLQIQRRLAGEIPGAHAADSNNSIIQINSHVTEALKEMSKIKKRLEAKKELRAKKEALILETMTEAPAESEVQKLALALAEASLLESSARLVIAYPRAVGQYPRGDHVIPLKKRLVSKDLFGVIQSKEDVKYTFSLPWSSRFIPDQLHIIYNPQSDDCVLEITVSSKHKYFIAKTNTKIHLLPWKR